MLVSMICGGEHNICAGEYNIYVGEHDMCW